MIRRLAWLTALGAAVVGTLLAAGPAQAGVIFDADTAPASAEDAFGRTGNGNCESGTIDVANDATFGRVWRFHKPSGSDRCEARGVRVGGDHFGFRNKTTYYLGWRSRLTDLANNNAVFQWKSFGDHIQNFPVVLKVIDGKLTMLQRQPEEKDHFPWARPIKANAWNHIALGIHTSDELTGGWVELYFNGVRQKFTNGSTRWPARTWDSENDPKWGIYGAEGTEVTNFVDALRVGTSFADVRAPGVPPAKVAPPRASPTPSPSSTGRPAPAKVRPADALPLAGSGPDAEPVAATGRGGGLTTGTTIALLGGAAGLAGLAGIATAAATRAVRDRRRNWPNGGRPAHARVRAR